MKYIRKIWSRILTSFLLGLVSTELFVLSMGNEYRQEKSLSIIAAIIFFILFTIIVSFEKYKHFFFPDKDE